MTGANTLAREAAGSLIDFRIPPNHRRYTGNNNSRAHRPAYISELHCGYIAFFDEDSVSLLGSSVNRIKFCLSIQFATFNLYIEIGVKR